MTKSVGFPQRFYIGGYDLSSTIGNYDSACPRGQVDMTPVNASGHVRALTHADGSITLHPFFDDGTGMTHDALKGLPTSNVGVMVPTSTTRGDPVGVIEGKQVNYDWSRPSDASLVGTVQVIGDGVPMIWDAILLVAKTTHASASDETGYLDPGEAQTAYGAVGYLQHFEADSGTVEYDLEDSSDSTDGDDGNWANLLAFNDVATPWAQIAERIEVTGAVEKYVRASTNGTFSNADFAMAFRRGTEFDDLDLS